MPIIHGFNWVIQLFPSGAASTNLTTELNSVSLKWDRNNPDVSTFGTTSTTKRLSGLRDYSIDFAGLWNSGTSTSTAEGVLTTEMNATTNTLFLIGPACTVSCPVYSGCAVLSNLTITGGMNAATAISFTLQAAAGSLTRGTAV